MLHDSSSIVCSPERQAPSEIRRLAALILHGLLPDPDRLSDEALVRRALYLARELVLASDEFDPLLETVDAQ